MAMVECCKRLWGLDVNGQPGTDSVLAASKGIPRLPHSAACAMILLRC